MPLPYPPHESAARGSAVSRAFLAVVVALVVVALLGQVLASCGDGPPSDGDVRDAAAKAPNKVYWAGNSFAGMPLAAIQRDGRWVTFTYADCRPDRVANCSPPLEIQTVSVCDLNPMRFESRPRANVRWRHHVLREYPDGRTNMVTIGASTVLIYARGTTAKRVLAALRPVGEPNGARPLRARYPRAFVAEVRRVHDAYDRLGSVRRVSDKLGMSVKDVRYRLVLARELGSRVHRPADSFLPSLKDVPVADRSVDFRSKCDVETY